MLVAPLVVATTVALFASGVALIVLGPSSDFVLNIHKASCILWVGAISIHVLVYVRRLRRSCGRLDARPPAARCGCRGRGYGGRLLAVATYPLADPWFDRVRGDNDQQEAVAPR
ncbi:MAG: hypothetical protein ABI948_05375 [Thermoleophilia bacterium]